MVDFCVYNLYLKTHHLEFSKFLAGLITHGGFRGNMNSNTNTLTVENFEEQLALAEAFVNAGEVARTTAAAVVEAENVLKEAQRQDRIAMTNLARASERAFGFKAN